MSKNTQLSQLVNGLYVDSAFNVGIGTTVPNYKLTVNGEVKTSGNFFAVNNTPFSTNGTITYHDTVGLVLRGVAGFAFDFSIYNPAGNALIANPTGTNNITFPNGNVGIGTSSPSYKLHVTGTSGVGARTIQADGTGTAFNIVSVVNNGSQMFLATEGVTAGTVATGSLAYAGVVDMNTNTALQFATFATVRMTITNGGNVGIGTTSPTNGYKLDVVGSILSQVASGNTSIVVQTNNANGALNALAGSGLELATDGTNQNIIFRTGISEKMRLASGGQLLIGTTTVNALEKLSVSGTASYSGVVRIENNANPVDVNHGILNLVNTLSYAVGNDASVMFSAKDFGGTIHPRASIGAKVASALGADLVFNTRNDSNFAERMRITSSGNVGIGTASPTTRLQVIGTISSTDLYLSGSYTQTIYTNEAWSSWQWAIPSGTLVGGGVYIVTLYFITDNWPWQVSCAFEYCPVNSNGAGADNTFTPLISTHTGGSGIIYARNVAVGGQICGGLQIYFSGFTKNTGTLYVRAIRIG